MEQLNEIPWEIVIPMTTTLVGVFFGCILILTHFQTGRYLGLLILAYSIAIAPISLTNLPINHWQIITILPTLLFIYSKAFFTPKSRIHYFDLIPVLLCIGLYYVPLHAGKVLAGFTMLLYVYRLIVFVRQESNHRGIQWFANPGARLVWFRNFITVNIIGLVILLWNTEAYIMTALVCFNMVYVIYQSWSESNFFTELPLGNKYQKSTLPPQIKAAVLDKIETVMEAEFYLRDDASLSNLADELGVTAHHLSQILNETLKISFQDLIARYRIRRACQILKDTAHNQDKVESIAAMVGYNSKSSFNAAFKKRTGLTPTAYRKSKNVRTYGEAHLTQREVPIINQSGFSLNHVFNLKMNRTMIRSSLRTLRKNKLHTALNILGLAIGLSACLIIAAYVQYEWSYDKHHPNAKDSYRIALNRIYPGYEKKWAITAPILSPTITQELPEIINYTRLQWDNSLFAKSGEPLESQRITGVDSGFFKVFKAEIIKGHVDNNFFKRQDGVILTQRAADKYFGQEDPIGKLFEIQLATETKSRLLSVEAVISNPSPNSHLDYDILTVITLIPFPDWMYTTWGTWSVYSYISVHPGTDPESLIKKINAIAEKHQAAGNDDFDAWQSAGNSYNYFLQPITSIHLNSNLSTEFEANSSETFVYFFAIVGVFILLMAVVNFVNLSTAKASYRTLEVGIRKVVGASRGDLMIQFLIESTLMSIVSMIFALGITQLLIPEFNEVVGKSISLQSLFSPTGLAILLVSPILLGIFAGFYPALYLSNFGPSTVFQKFNSKRGREKLRHLLVIGQFIIAVILITGTITVYRQMHFITNKPLGFDKDQLIKIDKLPFSGEKIEVFKQEAKRLPGVKSISTTSFPLDDIRSGSTLGLTPGNESQVNTTWLIVDEQFIPTMGIQLVAGRNLLPHEVGNSSEETEKILLNMAAIQALGLTPSDAIDKVLYETTGVKCTVVGVFENFIYESLHNSVEPLQLSGAYFPPSFRSATIKIDPRHMKEATTALASLSHQLAPDKVFEFDYMDESMAQYYEAEKLTGKLFVLFSGLGIFICCLGLFGLMSYVVEQRSKEVGIRKVLGARIRNIIMLLSRDYLKLVLISSLIAIPISWWGVSQWLDGFAFRVENSLLIFLLGGFVVTVVSWVTIAFYAFQATKSNLVNALRSE
ncbi:ABC transporter permease [Reichenbachiella sp.]|uniref:ABC transporter permease n=1 Tax=Reichenbachiella sp. TaxID=2184521 RepID=UPI003B5B6DFA